MPATFPDRSGIVKLPSGRIVDPVAFFDLTLPNGFDHFRFTLHGFVCSNLADGCVLSLSQDGGSTFINDNTNFDSYTHAIAATIPPFNADNATFGDSVIDLTKSGSMPSVGESSQIILFPGSDTQYPTLIAVGGNIKTPLDFALVTTLVFVNPSALVVPPLLRANCLRCTPYGNGDVNPPTSGSTIIAGSYTLWGIP